MKIQEIYYALGWRSWGNMINPPIATHGFCKLFPNKEGAIAAWTPGQDVQKVRIKFEILETKRRKRRVKVAEVGQTEGLKGPSPCPNQN